jgi:hypothetical protein
LKRRYRRLRVAFFLVAFLLPPFFAALRPPFFAAFLRPPFFLAAIVSLHDGVELSTRPPVEPPTSLASERARVVTSHAIIVRELQWRPRANIGTRKISRNNYFVQRKIFALATDTETQK